MALFPPGFRDLGASHLADRVRCASNSLSNPETLEWREFLDDGAIRCYNVLTPVLAPGDRNTSVRGPGRGRLGGDAAACECAPVVPWLSMRSSASTAPVVHATRTPLALYTTSDERHERRTPRATNATSTARRCRTSPQLRPRRSQHLPLPPTVAGFGSTGSSWTPRRHLPLLGSRA